MFVKLLMMPYDVFCILLRILLKVLRFGLGVTAHAKLALSIVSGMAFG